MNSARPWTVVLVEDNQQTLHFLEQSIEAHPGLRLGASPTAHREAETAKAHRG